MANGGGRDFVEPFRGYFPDSAVLVAPSFAYFELALARKLSFRAGLLAGILAGLVARSWLGLAFLLCASYLF